MVVFINKKLHLSGDNWEGSEAEIQSIITEIGRIYSDLYFFPECQVYYSSADLRRLVQNLNLVAELNEYFLTNPLIQILSLIQRVDANEVEQDQNFVNSISRHFYWDLNTMTVSEISKSLVSYAGSYSLDENESFILINLTGSKFNNRDVIPVLIDDHSGGAPRLANLKWIVPTYNIQKRVEELRPERVYHWSKKHGENGRDEWKGESVLYCNREQAKVMLQKAVGKPNDSDLYYYDEPIDRFMVFKDEKANGQYHSYHVEPADEQIQVPNIISKRLKKRKKA